MYKVFINDLPLALIEQLPDHLPAQNTLFMNYDSLSTLQQAVELLHRGDVKEVFIATPEVDNVWLELKNLYIEITAAGGVVRNTGQQVLLIYRNGKWDLPKGKVEPGEAVQEAAIREVQEECGLIDLSIKSALRTTYHTYTIGSERILKTTHWFELAVSGEMTPTPQTEEGITDTRWFDPTDMKEPMQNTHASIRELLGEVAG